MAVLHVKAKTLVDKAREKSRVIIQERQDVKEEKRNNNKIGKHEREHRGRI